MLLMKLPAYRVNQGEKGEDGKATTTFVPFGTRPAIMFTWATIFEHDHGQNSNFPCLLVNPKSYHKIDREISLAHDHGQIFGRRSMVFRIDAIVISRCDGQKR